MAKEKTGVLERSSTNQDSTKESSEGGMVDVSAADVRSEISGLLREAAKPVEPGESVKALIRKTATRMGLPFNRVRHLWYEEISNIPAFEADTIRRRFEVRARQRAQVRGMEDEIQDLKRRLQALESNNDGSANSANGSGGNATGVGLVGYRGHG